MVVVGGVVAVVGPKGAWRRHQIRGGMMGILVSQVNC